MDVLVSRTAFIVLLECGGIGNQLRTAWNDLIPFSSRRDGPIGTVAGDRDDEMGA
jgi:hypothetical protein